MRTDPDWLIPDWPAPAHVRAVCTTRSGGFSSAAYASMNLGLHVGDASADVLKNRAVLAQTIAAQPVFLNQVHGSLCLEVHLQSLLRANSEASEAEPPAADASLTRDSGLACTVMVADCLPVLLTDESGSFVAAAHAGWRGLAGVNTQHGAGILEQTLYQISTSALANHTYDASKIIAWLGPCIGPKSFEVGSEVKTAYVHFDAKAERFFLPASPGKYLADLAALARLRLLRMGVLQVYGNDSSDSWCTVSNPSRFFSYRRDGICGRFAACIWRD